MSTRSFLFVLLALVLCMTTAPVAVANAGVHVSQNAMARDGHRAAMQARHHGRRSIQLPGAARMTRRKATAEQVAAQQKLNDQAARFAAQNTEWQNAAIESLKKGQTPQTFDEYWGAKSNGGSTGAGQSDNQDDVESPSSTDSSPKQTWTKPDQQQPQQQAEDSNDDADDEQDSEQCDISTETEDDSQDEPAEAKPTKASNAAEVKPTFQQNHAKPSATSSSSSKPAASSQPAKPKQTKDEGGSSGGGGGKTAGQATFYAPGLGACGKTNNSGDHIVAVSAALFDSFGSGNPNNNPVCGRKIRATYQGKSTTVTVVDRCVGCAWGDLDFTETAFQDLAGLDLGRLSGMTWEWV